MHPRLTDKSKSRTRTLTLAAAAALSLAVASCSASTPATTGANGNQAPTSTGGAGGSSSAAGPGTTTPKTLARYAGFDSAVYSKDENWVCRNGRSGDLCTTESLATTIVKADGTTEVVDVPRDANPTYDCFYVYPTVNFGAGGNDDAMAADTAAEVNVTRNQAMRFSQQCKVYAPLYRQMMLGGFGSADMEQLTAKAYGDVRESFRYYMARWNEGRPVVLLGHSQGSGMLAQLMVDEFDGDDDADMRKLLVSAILGGGRTEVPPGKDVGGSFSRIPLCRGDDQTGCVIAFNTVKLGGNAESEAIWGKAETAGNQKACTNPASLATGKGRLDIITANQGEFAPGVTVATPWVEVTGRLQAECVTAGDITNLRVSVTQEPKDVRNGELFLSEPTSPIPWGLHINEMNLFQGNLLTIVRGQAAAMK